MLSAFCWIPGTLKCIMAWVWSLWQQICWKFAWINLWSCAAATGRPTSSHWSRCLVFLFPVRRKSEKLLEIVACLNQVEMPNLCAPDDLCSQRRPGVHRSLPQPPRPPLRSRSRLFQRELLSRAGCPLPGSGGRALQGPRRRRRRQQRGRWREKEESAENAHIWQPRVWRPASPRPSKE